MNTFRKLMALASTGAVALGLATPDTTQAQDMYLGQIVQVGFNFCPSNTVEASGQLLPISSNAALFSLLGTMYGGNGTSTFALPDLRGRVPMGEGDGPGLSLRQQGEIGGTETVTLTIAQMPAHNHSPRINMTRVDADSRNPIGNSFARAAQDTYVDNQAPDPAQQMHPGTISSMTIGGNQPISSMQPYLVTRYCITTVGLYPSRP